MRRRYVWLFGLAAICAAAALLYRYADLDICDTTIERSVPSPDGVRRLVIFHRDCGATVDFNTQVSVVPAGGSFSFEKHPAFFVLTGKYALPAVWLSPHVVRIFVPRGKKISRARVQVDGIAVRYELAKYPQ